MPELVAVNRIILGRGTGKDKKRIEVMPGRRFHFTDEEAAHLSPSGSVRRARDIEREQAEAERGAGGGLLEERGIAQREEEPHDPLSTGGDGDGDISRGKPPAEERDEL